VIRLDQTINNPHPIVCGGEKYYWKEGKGDVFDNMYLHHVMNPSEHRRAVLFIDFLRNDLPYPLDQVVYTLREYINSLRFLQDYDSKLHQQKSITSKIEKDGSRTESFTSI
ncbi:hypothetical protein YASMINEVIRUS_734, partial [Yasminevirus sp. GU-2018]